MGAITGGLIGAIAGGISAVSQGKTSFRDIAAGAAGGAVSGAATGALVGSGVGLVAVAGGSFVGGAAGSAAENVIAHGAKNLDAGAVVKDAAVDGGISAVASLITVGGGKAVKGKLIQKAASKANSSAPKGIGFLKRSTLVKQSMDKSQKMLTTAKPLVEGIIATSFDYAQDKIGPDVIDEKN